MREHYFTLLQPTGILAPSTPPRLGIFNPTADPLSHQGLGGTPDSSIHDLLGHIQTTPHYHTFLSHPTLRAFIRHFMGWESEIMLPRSLLRHKCSGSLSTGIHYDKLFLSGGGDAEFLTAWVPIGDVAPNGGGLMYLENSGPLGKEVEDEFNARAGGVQRDGEEECV